MKQARGASHVLVNGAEPPARTRPGAGMAPLSPQRKWRAITLATLVLVPAYWAILLAFVAGASDDHGGIEQPAAAVAFGFALLPFVFVVLAFLSEHPSAPGAVVRAMGLCLPQFGEIVFGHILDGVMGRPAVYRSNGLQGIKRLLIPHLTRQRPVEEDLAVVAVDAVERR